jgi:hypothetical protein
MRVPPRLVRRLLLAPVLLLLEGALVLASPVLALVARLLGGRRARRAHAITVE